MENKTEVKKRLLDIIDMISKTNMNAIHILRSNCVSQINTVERNSKSIKDPDPLSSTMANISLKYPITVDEKVAKEMKIPSHLLMPCTDVRKFNRRPCKLETLNWYIENGPAPTNEVKSIVTSMMEANSKKLEFINSIDWEDIQFQPGNVIVNRKRIPTNPQEVRIPRELKRSVMAKILGIESYIEYSEVPTHMLEYAQKIFKEHNHLPKRVIPSALHFMTSLLDERYRCLPILGGMTSDFLHVTHVLVQPRYMATNIGSFVNQTHRQNVILTNVCINLLHYLERSPENVKTLCSTITIGAIPLLTLLQDTHENKYVRSIKAMVGMPVSSYIELSGCSFYPIHANTQFVTKQNKSHVPYITVIGVETVNFEMSGVKGVFTHNEDMLKEIIINDCDLSIIKKVLPKIAIFCCMGFSNSKAKTRKTMVARMETHWAGSIHTIIGVTEQSYSDWVRRYGTPRHTHSLGILQITTGIDFQETLPLSLTQRGEYLVTSTGQRYMEIPKIVDYQTWDVLVDTPNLNLLRYFPMVKMLPTLIKSVWADMKTLKERILNNVWFNKTHWMLASIPQRLRSGVIISAREKATHHAQAANPNYLILSTLYVFTGSIPMFNYDALPIETFTLTNAIHVNLNLLVGDLTYAKNTDNKERILLKETTVLSTRSINSEPIKRLGLIDNFELEMVRRADFSYEKMPLYKIKEIGDNVPDGTKFYTNIRGVKYIATKNSNISVDINNTMMRCSLIHSEPDAMKEISTLLGKRKRQDLENIEDVSALKRRREAVCDSASISSGS